MESHKSYYLLLENEKITLKTSTGSSIKMQLVDVSLDRKGEKITDCRITVRCNYEIYEIIDDRALFHLFLEARGLMTGDGLDPSLDVEIEAKLSQLELAKLTEFATSAEEVATHLLDASKNQPEDRILETESWFGLYVKQNIPLPPELQETGELKMGYRTIWAEEKPSIIQEKSLLETMMDFFNSQDWTFSQVEGQSTLSMPFKGKSGEWMCYAHTREKRHQCIFYSVCPVKAPESKWLVIVELLTRANYGLPVGNFEMDLEDGEIRYKTGINITGDRLSPEIITQMVTENTKQMDKYLPAILQVTYSDVSPKELIDGIES